MFLLNPQILFPCTEVESNRIVIFLLIQATYLVTEVTCDRRQLKEIIFSINAKI